jgi:hypothetical protein
VVVVNASKMVVFCQNGVNIAKKSWLNAQLFCHGVKKKLNFVEKIAVTAAERKT